MRMPKFNPHLCRCKRSRLLLELPLQVRKVRLAACGPTYVSCIGSAGLLGAEAVTGGLHCGRFCSHCAAAVGSCCLWLSCSAAVAGGCLGAVLAWLGRRRGGDLR